MSNELTDVRCSCGDEYPADSYDAGFIAGSGMCQNCDAALPPKDICTCPSGDGSLRHPCPAHPAVEQAGGDERAAFFKHLIGRHPAHETEIVRVVEHNYAAWKAWQARAALAQPSPKCSTCNGTGQIVVSGPHYCGELQPPEYEAEPCDMCSQPSQAQAEKAEVEAERPEVVAFLMKPDTYEPYVDLTRDWSCDHWEALMTVAQHERIVGSLRAEIAEWQEAAGRGRSDVVTYIAERAKLLEERDAALARVAELEKLSRAHDPLRIGLAAMIGTFKTASNPGEESTLRMANQLFDATADARYGAFKNKAIVDRLIAGLAAPVAQAQHSVPIAPEFKRALGLVVATLEADGDRPTSKYALSELKKVLAAAPGKEGL